MFRYMILIIFISFTSFLYSQSNIPTVAIQEVSIESTQNIKQKTFGYQNQFAIGTNLYQLPREKELAVELDCKRNKITLTQIHLNISNSDSSNKFILVRIRNKDSLNTPDKILYEKEITLTKTNSNNFVLEVPSIELQLSDSTLFLTVELCAKSNAQHVNIFMTKRVKSNALINENLMWRKLGSPVSTKWNAKFGITAFYKK